MNIRAILPVILILLMIFRLPSGESEIVEKDGVIEYWSIPPGESVVLKGVDLVVNGSLILDGNLTLDNATLRIWNNGTIYHNGGLELINGSFLDLNQSISMRITDGSLIDIVDSRIRNAVLSKSDMKISGSDLENSTVWMDSWDTISNSTFHDGLSNDMEALVISSESKVSVTNVTIKGYHTGIRSLSGGFELVASNITDCENGIISSSDSPVGVTGSSIEVSQSSISSSSSLNIKNSVLKGGSVDLAGSSLISTYSEFNGLEEISGVGSGIIRNSSFIDCEYGLSSPSDVTITGSLFSGCDVAINQPTGSLIYHNSFISNREVVLGIPVSNWYNSVLMEGNFYSEYSGSDDGSNDRFPGDGIGDTNLPYLGRDQYPLMKDHLWDMPKVTDLRLDYLRGTGMINLTWVDTGGTGFIIQRSNSKEFDVNVVSWSVTGNNVSIENNPNGTLHFRIGIYNDFGYRGWSRYRTAIVDQAPLPPSHVTVESPAEGSSLIVKWSQQGEDIKRTYLIYSQFGGKISQIPIDYPKDEITIAGLKNGIIYNISMINEDNAGQLSSPTLNMTGTPVDTVPAPPPRSLRGVASSNTTIEIFWDPPLVQDISNYLIYRRLEGEQFRLIANLSRLSYSYVDRELTDNVTYIYAMRSIDDDGPLSTLSDELRVSTLHYNREPTFSGEYQYIPLIEDGGPFQIRVSDLVSDPDGDDVLVILRESYRVKAELVDDVLWIIPSEDQAGSGFINLLASDGESSTFFVIGVMIEEVPDPPQDVFIISPDNGSVLLPGSQVLFQVDAFDPDVPYGDNLTYRWESDMDGLLNGNGSRSEHIYRSLTPGQHNITLTVSDRNGTRVQRSVTVMVSLWGWGDPPWSATVLSSDVSENGGSTRVRIENRATIRLTFTVTPADIGTIQVSRERRVTIPPSSSAVVDLDIRPPLSPGAVIFLNWSVEAETINGTFAGQEVVTESTVVNRLSEEDDSSGLVLILMVISALLTIVAVIGVIILGMSGRRTTIDQNIEDEDSHQETNEGEPNGR